MVRIRRFSSRDVNSLSRFTHRFNSIFFKISARFLVDIGKFIFKFTWKDIGPRVDKTILETKGRIILANIKTQCVATIEQFNIGLGTDASIIDTQKFDPHKYLQPSFDKSAKAFQWRKARLFNKWR